MAAKSNLTNMALCLTLVCLLCSAILGVMYAVTYEPIRKAEKDNLIASLSEVLPAGSEVSAEPEMLEMNGTQYECYRAGEAVAVKSTVNGFGGPLTVLVGIGADGKVCSTKVLSHSETPGLGAKCSETESHFVQQFKGFDPSAKKLVVTKDGGDVDAITASTITSRAYTLAVSNAVELIKAKRK